MQFGTFCCNLTVSRKTFFRFWPLWAAYTVIWLLVLPLQGLMHLQMDAQAYEGVTGRYLESFSKWTVSGTSELALVLAVVFGLLAAMAVCSHLYSPKSSNFMGTLPARREGLFLSHYLPGLAMLLLPNLLIFVLTLLVEVAGGAVYMGQLAFWLGYVCAVDLFFYSFAVCLGMFTGHLLALPLFYAVFNGLAVGLYELVTWVLIHFYYGFSSMGSTAKEAVKWLTPAWRLGQVRFSPWTEEVLAAGGTVEEGGALAVYAVAGLVLTAVALLLYRRRNLETAGDVVAVRAMRPVFKYGVALCAGLFFGYFTAGILGTESTGMMVAMLLWGVAGYFAAQMLLDKTFRVLRHWKGGAAVAAAFLILFAVVIFDLTGFETRVPEPAQVASVEVWGLDSAPYDGASYVHLTVDDSETIALLTELHQSAVDQRDGVEPGGTYDNTDVNLIYRLKNGSTLTRRYDVRYKRNEMNQEGTAAWVLNQLLSDRELIWRAYEFDLAMEIQAKGGWLVSAGYQNEHYFGADAQALLDAVIQDFEAGNIGVRTLKSNGSWEEQATLRFTWNRNAEELQDGVMTAHSVEIAVTETAVETILVLNRLSSK